jgi:hypothetical protein
VFPVKYGQTYRVALKKTGRWIVSRIVIVILIYHRHKPIDVMTCNIHSSDASLQKGTLIYVALKLNQE